MAAPATTVMNAITDTEEKVFELLHDLQAPVVTYVRKAVAYVESSMPELPTRDLGENLPTFKQFVDNQFVFAGKVLDDQHKFVVELHRGDQAGHREGRRAEAGHRRAQGHQDHRPQGHDPQGRSGRLSPV